MPPLLRVHAYVLLTVGFLGMWIWLGLDLLVALLLGLDSKGAANGRVIFLGWIVCWILVLPATLMWHLPELSKRELGPLSKRPRGYTGHLVRRADRGVLGGPLELRGATPPVHFWIVGVLYAVISGFGAGRTVSSDDSLVWKALLWVAFLACLLSLAVLAHGAVTRRRSPKKASAPS